MCVGKGIKTLGMCGDRKTKDQTSATVCETSGRGKFVPAGEKRRSTYCGPSDGARSSSMYVHRDRRKDLVT